MGRRRSVYLSDETDDRLEAGGWPLPEVIEAGLAALEGLQFKQADPVPARPTPPRASGRTIRPLPKATQASGKHNRM